MYFYPICSFITEYLQVSVWAVGVGALRLWPDDGNGLVLGGSRGHGDNSQHTNLKTNIYFEPYLFLGRWDWTLLLVYYVIEIMIWFYHRTITKARYIFVLYSRCETFYATARRNMKNKNNLKFLCFKIYFFGFELLEYRLWVELFVYLTIYFSYSHLR